MTSELRNVRLHVLVTPSESAVIDAWRFANFVPSKSEAIRQLVQIGLGDFEPQPRPQKVDVDRGDAATSNELPAGRFDELRAKPWRRTHEQREQSLRIPADDNEPSIKGGGTTEWIVSFVESQNTSLITLEEIERGLNAPGAKAMVETAMSAYGWKKITRRRGPGKPAETFFIAPGESL